jgi:hypothetical protein
MISMSKLAIGTDRPTMIYKDGTMIWLVNNKYHRENGPAIVRVNGSKEYWINGNMHRTDGPAFFGQFYRTKWYVNNIDITEGVQEWLSNTKYKWPFNDYQQMEFKMRFCCGD